MPEIKRLISLKQSFSNQSKIPFKSFNRPIKPLRSLVDGSKHWVQTISAYYDDRAGLGDYVCVRVILIRDIKVVPKRCILFNANYELLLAKRPWLQNIGIGMKYKKIIFREEIVSCCVSRSTKHPTFVTLVYTDKKHIKPQTESNSSFIKVQYPPKPVGKQRKIINCVSATFGHPNPRRVVEWLELQRFFGMDKVEIHDINMHKETRRIFEAYSKEAGDGFVELLDLSPVLIPDKYNLLHMSPAINDCLLRNMHSFKAVAVFDLDEVILPRANDTYEELVTFLRELAFANNIPQAHFLFHNVYYYMNIKVVRPSTWTSTFTRYLHHVKPSPAFHHVKSIIDPKACFAMHNHFCWADVDHEPKTKAYKLSKGPILKHVNVNIAANQHYKFCIGCRENLTIFFKDKTLLKYQERLDERILKKFKALGLKDY